MNDPDNTPPAGNGSPDDAAEREHQAEGTEAAPEKGVALVEEPAPTRADVAALERENADLREQLLRRRADFENYRKRVERERATAGQEAVSTLLKDLVASLDNIERALESPGDGASVREGVALIQRALLAALESHGLRVADPTGQPFDPESHQALSYDDAPGHADGTVVRVFGKGYFHKDRLLRPALVQVARGGPPAEDGHEPEAAPGNTSRTDELH